MWGQPAVVLCQQKKDGEPAMPTSETHYCRIGEVRSVVVRPSQTSLLALQETHGLCR